MNKLLRKLFGIDDLVKEERERIATELHRASLYFRHMPDAKEALWKACRTLRASGHVDAYEIKAHVEEVKAERDFNE